MKLFFNGNTKFYALSIKKTNSNLRNPFDITREQMHINLSEFHEICVFFQYLIGVVSNLRLSDN